MVDFKKTLDIGQRIAVERLFAGGRKPHGNHAIRDISEVEVEVCVDGSRDGSWDGISISIASKTT